MNNPIYVVTKGSYSDYHIVAVTTDKEIAETIKKRYDEDDEYYNPIIEEYIDGALLMNRKRFFMKINANFEIVECSEQVIGDYDFNDPEISFNRIREDIGYYVTVCADSFEKAKKILYDKIAEYKARKEGL